MIWPSAACSAQQKLAKAWLDGCADGKPKGILMWQRASAGLKGNKATYWHRQWQNN